MASMIELIEAILNGEEVDFEPKTVTQAYLKACVNRDGCNGLPAPATRASALLYRLAQELAGTESGGGSSEVLTNVWSKDYNNGVSVDATTSEQVLESEYDTVELPEDARIFFFTAKVKNATGGYTASLNLYVRNTSDKLSGLYTFGVKDGVAKSISGVSGLYASFGDPTDDGYPLNLCIKKAASLTGDFNALGEYSLNLYAVELDSLTDLFNDVLGI